MKTQFATVNAQFVVGKNGAAWPLPVADMVDAAGQLTNKAFAAITEVVESNTTLGITARAPHNKKEHIDEVNAVVSFLNQEVDRVRQEKATQKQMSEGDVSDMVIIGEGVSISAEQVLYAMEQKGLVVGGECETAKGGYGVVHHFEVNGTEGEGLIVHVDIDGAIKRFRSADVSRVQDEAALAVEAAGLVVPEEADTLDQEVRAMIESFVDEEGKDVELTAEERFNAQEAERTASRAAWNANREIKASAVAGSSAAQQILDLAKQLLPARAQAAVQTKTQTNGGNVQMTTNTQTRGAAQTQGTSVQQDRPAQGVAGGSAAQTPSRPSTRGNAGAQAAGGNLKVQAPARGNVGTRTNVGAAATANTGRKKLGLKKDAMVSMTRDVWYMDAVKFPEVISGAEFEDGRANLALGITDAKMYDAEEYSARFNREANENDIAVMEVFFGKVSFEFKIRASVSEDARSPWYCANITFVENRRSSGGAWKYTVARRSDAVEIVITEDGKIREATVKEIEAKQTITVGGKTWKNKETVYGINMGEEVIAQVMRWAHYGWEAANAPAVQA